MGLRKCSLLLVFLSAAVTVCAQGGTGKAGQAIAKALSRDFTIVHNATMGMEILRAVRPLGELPAVSPSVHLAPKLPQTSFRVHLSVNLSKKITQTFLPGYFRDFKTQFAAYAEQVQLPSEYWETWLGRAFNQNQSFQGYFVKDFQMAVELLDVPVVDGGTPMDAVREAFMAGLQSQGSGFFVVAQHENASRAKDVYVLDIPNRHWISLKESRGYVLGKRYQGLRQSIQETNFAQEEMLAKRGVLVRVDNPIKPTELEVSLDGIRWDRYSMETKTAQKLWAGWKEGVYISYRKSTGVVLYGENAHAPMFNSLDVLKEFIRQQ